MPPVYSHHGGVFTSQSHAFFELNTLNKYTDINFRLFSFTLQEPYKFCGKKGKDSTTTPPTRMSKPPVQQHHLQGCPEMCLSKSLKGTRFYILNTHINARKEMLF